MTDPDVPPAADPIPEAPLPPASRLPPPDSGSPPPEHAGRESQPPTAPHADALPWLCGLGFLLLAGGIGYVAWLAQQPSPALIAVQRRVAVLEQRPTGSNGQNVDLQALQDQVAALQKRQAPDLAPLQAQIAALQHSPGTDLAPLEARIGALEKQVADVKAASAGASQVADRLNTLSTQVQALAARDQTADSDLAHRLDAAEAHLAALEQTVAQTVQTAQRAARLARIDVAQAALAAGRPLGDINGAPPTVAKFATATPPTEAALRLAFPKAAQAALDAAGPDTAGKPFLRQVLARAQDLITLRQGDQVLVGNPAAGLLARAHAALDAGDLAGAVAAVSSLSGPSAAAMAGWLADARALLAARAGLADMAAHA